MSLVIGVLEDEIEAHSLFRMHFRKKISDGSLALLGFATAHDCLDYLHAEEKSDHPLIDILFVDINMPGMDGFTFIKMIKGDHPKMELIVCTGYDLPKYKVLSHSLGCKHFIAKPIDFQLIDKIVEEKMASH